MMPPGTAWPFGGCSVQAGLQHDADGYDQRHDLRGVNLLDN
jgi:hypothetical protein